MSADWTDRFGEQWVDVDHERWSRLRDGASITVDGLAGRICLSWCCGGDTCLIVDDTGAWLAEHFGAPDLGLPDSDAVFNHRRAVRMDKAWRDGWVSAWRASPAYQPYPGGMFYDDRMAPHPDRSAHEIRSFSP